MNRKENIELAVLALVTVATDGLATAAIGTIFKAPALVGRLAKLKALYGPETRIGIALRKMGVILNDPKITPYRGLRLSVTKTVLSRKEILNAFENISHTATSQQILQGIKDGTIRVVFKRNLSKSGLASGNRIYVNSRMSIEDVLTTLVHEGQHSLDIAAGVIPKLNPGGVTSLVAELRAWKAAARFAGKNNYRSTQAFRYFSTDDWLGMAIEIEASYRKQIGRKLTDAELWEAIQQVIGF